MLQKLAYIYRKAVLVKEMSYIDNLKQQLETNEIVFWSVAVCMQVNQRWAAETIDIEIDFAKVEIYTFTNVNWKKSVCWQVSESTSA